MTNIDSFSYPSDEPKLQERAHARAQALGYKKYAPYIIDLIKCDLERADSLEEIRRRIADRETANTIDREKLTAIEAKNAIKAVQENNALQSGYQAIAEAGADEVVKRFKRYSPPPDERGQVKVFKDEWFAEYADRVLPDNPSINRERLISDMKELAQKKLRPSD